MTCLRVYEPVEVFPAAQRARWAPNLRRDDANTLAEEAERRETWRRLVRTRLAPAAPATPAAPTPADDGADGEVEGGVVEGGVDAGMDNGADGGDLAAHARVLRIDGALLICPASIGDDAGPRRALVRAWDVPVPWLVLVSAADRTPDDCAGRYLVPMSGARARAARALRTLRAGLPGSAITAEVEVLARWLEGFHARSWLELDGRLVAALVGGDDGMDDVRMGLECLADADTAGVAAVYQRLRRRSRWLTDISRLS